MERVFESLFLLCAEQTEDLSDHASDKLFK